MQVRRLTSPTSSSANNIAIQASSLVPYTTRHNIGESIFPYFYYQYVIEEIRRKKLNRTDLISYSYRLSKRYKISSEPKLFLNLTCK
jgi:hypothetical protein